MRTELRDRLDSLDTTYFIGMEYYRLVLNRTYLVIFNPQCIIGIIAHGLLAVDPAVMKSQNNSAIYNNPLTYINEKLLDVYSWSDLSEVTIMNSNKNNFIYNHYDLSDISFNPSKKWGMANIPHNGRLNIELRNGKSREFILLGAQEETEIIQRFNEMYKR